MTFLFPLLDRLSDGRYISQIVVFCIRGMAALVALSWLLALLGVLKFTFSPAAPGSASIAGVAIAALFVAAALAMIQVLLYRSAKVAQLQAGAYVLIGIAAHLVRMFAEIVAAFVITVGGSTFIAGVLAGAAAGQIAYVIPGPFGSLAASGGVGGFAALLVAMTLAFTIIIAGYLGAEFLEIIPGMAIDVRRLTGNGIQICRNCEGSFPESDLFCTVCGTPVRTAVPA